MPATRVALRKGKSAEYKATLLHEIYEAMREAVPIKEGDRFMALTEHEACEFAYGETFLGLRRTDDLVQIQIFWSPGKGVATKQALYRRLVERLGAALGIRGEDVFICVFEAPAENWSFGNGETQFNAP
jgi:4-oxalocrotonate tautomerase